MPKGISASFAILKHCIPNGIPIIVQHKRIPFIVAETASGMPLSTIHKIFARNETVLPPYCTSLPNGKKQDDAILKHWHPIGIPIIVIHHSIPHKLQQSPCHNPPNKNHIKFPRHP